MGKEQIGWYSISDDNSGWMDDFTIDEVLGMWEIWGDIRRGPVYSENDLDYDWLIGELRTCYHGSNLIDEIQPIRLQERLRERMTEKIEGIVRTIEKYHQPNFRSCFIV